MEDRQEAKDRISRGMEGIYELIPHPETIGQRMVKVFKRRRTSKRLDLNELLYKFWEDEKELRSDGWLGDIFVEVHIRKDHKNNTIVDIREVEK